MSVPDTNTFALSDVHSELGLTVLPSGLGDAFYNSVDWRFDPSYKGNKDRLSNFRNYGRQVEETVGCAKHQSIYASGSSWDDTRNAAAGTLDDNSSIPSKMYQTVEGKSGGGFEIHRNFLEFDLSNIPTEAEIDSAYFEFRVVDEFTGTETNDVFVVAASFGSDILSGDFDSFTSEALFTGGLSSEQDQNGHKLIKKDANSVNLDNLKKYFGGMLKVCVRHSKDFFNSSPQEGDHYGYTSWRAGESVSGDFGVPVIHIVYH